MAIIINMERLKQINTYPFGLFLWLEWILCSSLFLGYFPQSFIRAEYRLANESIALVFIVFLLCIVALGLMGVKLPSKNSLHKWIYFLVQLALVLTPAFLAKDASYSIYACLIVSLRNCLIFKPKQCLLANIILLLSLIPCFLFTRSFSDFQARLSKYQNMTMVDYEKLVGTSTLSNIFEAALCMTLVWMVINVVLKEHKSQQQLAIAREQLRQYALKAEDRATVYERNRIAREIHDSVGHVLTAQTIQLNNAIAYWQIQPDKAYQFLTEAKHSVTTALQEIRHSIQTLRSHPLQGKKLENALCLLFRDFSSRTRIQPDRNFKLDRSLTEEIKLTVYRTVQEALTNIVKHSNAKSVKINLQTFARHLYLSIEDNGKGFNPEQNTTGFGLQGMKERITSLNGKIEISSELNSGCRIIVYIPYQTSL